MFYKKSANPGSHAETSGKPAVAEKSQRDQGSLALHLTLFFGASAFLVVLLSGGLMYWVVGADLRREHSDFLAEQAEEFRDVLRNPVNDAASIQNSIQTEMAEESGKGYQLHIRVIDPAGKTVAQSPGMLQELPIDVFPPPQTTEFPEGVSRQLRMPTGDPRWFHLAAVTASDPAGRHYTIQIAMDLASELRLLSKYRTLECLVLLPALVCSILIGYAIARRGIRPVEEIAAIVGRVQSTRLGERIDPSKFPSELASLADSFNEMLSRIEDGFSRLSRFSADIAHELRTPIGIIRGELEVSLAKPRQAADYRIVMESCLDECVRLNQLIDKLLFLARADNDQAGLRRERLELGKELEKLIEFYEPSAMDAGIQLGRGEFHVVHANVDRSLFQSAVGNLLDNALSHSPVGGTVTLDLKRANAMVNVAVSDQGPGIAPADLPYVFDRFFRVDASRARKDGGLGLGLALVKSIVTLHGGRVEIDSTPGVGTKVTLVLPAADEGAAMGAQASPHAVSQARVTAVEPAAALVFPSRGDRPL